MSVCSWCGTDVIWVPTIEGYRPYVSEVPVPAESPVAVLRRHECEERQQALKDAQAAYARNLAADPEIRARALTVQCPSCDAAPAEECRDQRRGFEGQHNKHPHQPRLVEGARILQEEAADG